MSADQYDTKKPVLDPNCPNCGQRWPVSGTEMRTGLSDEPSEQWNTLQAGVKPWLDACFGPEVAADKIERNHRFIEEALELVQACGCTREHAHQIVDYVYGRPTGEPFQEVGGVMVTLAALCLANGLDMHQAGDAELQRVWFKIEQIRTKQAAKKKDSALPSGASSPPSGVRSLPMGPARIVANFAHAALHILDDYAEENAQTGEAVVEIPAFAWKELNSVLDLLGDDPHEVMHDLIGVNDPVENAPERKDGDPPPPPAPPPKRVIGEYAPGFKPSTPDEMSEQRFGCAVKGCANTVEIMGRVCASHEEMARISAARDKGLSRAR